MVAISASCCCAVHLKNSSIMSIWKEVRTFAVFYSASFVVIGILETCFQSLSQLLNCCVMVATDSWLISGVVLTPWDLKPFQQNANSPVISTQCHIANKTNVILTPEMVFSQYTHIFLVIMVMAMITIIIIIIINFPHHHHQFPTSSVSSVFISKYHRPVGSPRHGALGQVPRAKKPQILDSLMQ